MKTRINYRKTSFVFDESYGSSPYQFATINAGDPAHPSKSGFVWAMPLAAIFLFGNGGSAFADTSDVKGPAPVIVAKSGEHCKDDPNCFNRIHYAVKPVAHVQPGQHFILETRDGLDSDLNFSSTAEDVAAVDLNRCHPLTGPVYIEGAKKGRFHCRNRTGHRSR